MNCVDLQWVEVVSPALDGQLYPSPAVIRVAVESMLLMLRLVVHCSGYHSLLLFLLDVIF
jgi:hypothetical protein